MSATHLGDCVLVMVNYSSWARIKQISHIIDSFRNTETNDMDENTTSEWRGRGKTVIAVLLVLCVLVGCCVKHDKRGEFYKTNKLT